MRLVVVVLALLLGGCAATARGDAENACNFAFLASLPMPGGVILGAAICTFGLELVPDEEEQEEEGDA